MSQNQNASPLQQSVDWIAGALNDFAQTMPRSVRDAFVARANACVQQVLVGLAPAPTAPIPADDPTPTPIRRGKRAGFSGPPVMLEANGAGAQVPTPPSTDVT